MPTRDRFSVSRRSLLIGGANIVAAGTFLSALGPLARAADAKPIKVGFSLCGDTKRLWVESVVCRCGEAHCSIPRVSWSSRSVCPRRCKSSA